MNGPKEKRTTQIKGMLRVMCLVGNFNIFEIEFFSKSFILIAFQSVFNQFQ